MPFATITKSDQLGSGKLTEEPASRPVFFFQEEKLMKAVVCTKYGPPDVLELREVPKPTPKNNEVLIKIYATTCHIGDVRVRSFDVPF